MSVFKIFKCVALSAIMVFMPSCSDEPRAIAEPKTVEISANGGFESVKFIREMNLLTIISEYPDIRVHSIYSTVVEPPKIAYYDLINDLNQLPDDYPDKLNWNETAPIKDRGGYYIKIKTYDAAIKRDCSYYVKLMVKDNTDSDGYGKIELKYQVFEKL